MTTAGFFPAPSGGVLVASPSMVVRDQVTRKLERHGTVHTACGGAEALAKLENGQWQMLFLDRRLPDLDAGELVLIIERRFPGIRVVMVDSETVESEKPSALDSVETGVQAFSHGRLRAGRMPKVYLRRNYFRTKT